MEAESSKLSLTARRARRCSPPGINPHGSAPLSSARRDIAHRRCGRSTGARDSLSRVLPPGAHPALRSTPIALKARHSIARGAGPQSLARQFTPPIPRAVVLPTLRVGWLTAPTGQGMTAQGQVRRGPPPWVTRPQLKSPFPIRWERVPAGRVRVTDSAAKAMGLRTIPFNRNLAAFVPAVRRCASRVRDGSSRALLPSAHRRCVRSTARGRKLPQSGSTPSFRRPRRLVSSCLGGVYSSRPHLRPSAPSAATLRLRASVPRWCLPIPPSAGPAVRSAAHRRCALRHLAHRRCAVRSTARVSEANTCK
jgi:hypothetical protein